MTESTAASAGAHPVDLHTHSTFSDGLLSPTELISAASHRGIHVLALTDHDTLEGLPEAVSASQHADIALIPGLELSAWADGHEVHILGYFVDPRDSVLSAALEKNAEQRLVRTERIIERLSGIGLPVSFERVQAIAGEGTIGRPHIARAMIERGYINSVSEAFDRYLGIGAPAFVPRTRTPAEEAVRLLREAKAIPVLAHPLSAGDIESTLRTLVPAGLLGLEAYYGEYPPQARAQLKAIAEAWGLVPTGGSDYHGPGYKEGRELGSGPVPMSSVAGLERLRQSDQGNSSVSGR